MEYPDIIKQADWQQVVRELRGSKRPEIEKLAYAFSWITDRIVEQGMKDIELARALRDEDSLIKNRIKIGAIRHARSIFQDCHMLATGKKAWDE
jgi:hypothetical protein